MFHLHPVPLNEKYSSCPWGSQVEYHLISLANTHQLCWALFSQVPLLAWLTPADPSCLKCYLKSISLNYTFIVPCYHVFKKIHIMSTKQKDNLLSGKRYLPMILLIRG